MGPSGDSPRASALGRYLTLVAIAAVVVVISLPRLREFALRENESDARALLARLGAKLEIHAAERPASVAALVSAADAADTDDRGGLSRWLGDAEYLAEGRLLRRHGYLFDVAEGPDRRFVVRAWPWRAGRTGTLAFVDPVGAAPLAHANQAARFSGPDSPPELSALGVDSGWSAADAGE